MRNIVVGFDLDDMVIDLCLNDIFLIKIEIGIFFGIILICSLNIKN
jgi:hypothetical protein